MAEAFWKFHTERAPQTINPGAPGLDSMSVNIPRLVIAGLSGDSGKTIVSLSLIYALNRKGLSVSVFKKGPDYIDSAWLAMAAGHVCRNLDTYMVEPDTVFGTFAHNASDSDISIIEGNRGLFDGKDLDGTHSTAGLAKLLQAPVVLVINTTKATRTLAAIVSGCISFDPDVRIAGVILNKVAGKRHQQIITESIEKYCNIPVLGSIPKLGMDDTLIPGRHLGLITPSEFDSNNTFSERMTEIAENYLDLDRLLEISRTASPIDVPAKITKCKTGSSAKIGYFKDNIFTFYYPENLEALKRCGAELVPISSVGDKHLPDIDGLYIGGGFPEVQAERLAENKAMLKSVYDSACDGLPIYAECGGLIYLSRSITWNEKTYPMAGVFPIDLKMNKKPVGHGYSEMRIDRENPYFAAGLVIRGHEFHYSSLITPIKNLTSCMSVCTGTGIGGGRDGLIYNNTLAAFVHIHADGVQNWASSFVKAAEESKKNTDCRMAADIRAAM